MPLPLILAGVAVAAAGYGAKKGYDGYQTKSEAEEIKKKAESLYYKYGETFDKHSEATERALENLGSLQLKIGSDFNEFKQIADELLKKLENAQQKELTINLPQYKLDKIDDLSMSATTYLRQLAGGAAAGAAAAYAAYGGVMALAAASTGTPIAALSGAAAYNATMAALGGGSLATGGLGMAGGTAVLGSVVAAPIIAIAGWAYNNHAEKAKEDAQQFSVEVKSIVSKINIAVERLKETEEYVFKIKDQLDIHYQVFTKYFEGLKAISLLVKNGMESVINSISNDIMFSIQNGYQVAAILADIIMTPLFKVKKDENGDVVMREDNVPELELDSENMQVLNRDEMDLVLSKNS
ncbi:chemotaxis protein [Pasteurellaceae bacterium Orientalotternb1]|nr:chemotaxis protein [Pasteurellaceae bacterium Orientalotternb1]